MDIVPCWSNKKEIAQELEQTDGDKKRNLFISALFKNSRAFNFRVKQNKYFTLNKRPSQKERKAKDKLK